MIDWLIRVFQSCIDSSNGTGIQQREIRLSQVFLVKNCQVNAGEEQLLGLTHFPSRSALIPSCMSFSPLAQSLAWPKLTKDIKIEISSFSEFSMFGSCFSELSFLKLSFQRLNLKNLSHDLNLRRSSGWFHLNCIQWDAAQIH